MRTYAQKHQGMYVAASLDTRGPFLRDLVFLGGESDIPVVIDLFQVYDPLAAVRENLVVNPILPKEFMEYFNPDPDGPWKVYFQGRQFLKAFKNTLNVDLDGLEMSQMLHKDVLGEKIGFNPLPVTTIEHLAHLLVGVGKYVPQPEQIGTQLTSDAIRFQVRQVRQMRTVFYCLYARLSEFKQISRTLRKRFLQRFYQGDAMKSCSPRKVYYEKKEEEKLKEQKRVRSNSEEGGKIVQQWPPKRRRSLEEVEAEASPGVRCTPNFGYLESEASTSQGGATASPGALRTPARGHSLKILLMRGKEETASPGVPGTPSLSPDTAGQAESVESLDSVEILRGDPEEDELNEVMTIWEQLSRDSDTLPC